MNDISNHPDDKVGAVARVIHQGCSKVMKDFFSIAPVQESPEGQKIKVTDESQLGSYKLLGNYNDQLPIEGTLMHKGWRTDTINLPKTVNHNSEQQKIITPAELQLN